MPVWLSMEFFSADMASVLLERKAGGFVEDAAVLRVERVPAGQREQDAEANRAPGLGEAGEGLVGEHGGPSSAHVGPAIVGLEVDHRAENLQVGDQGVGLRDSAGVAVEVAG